MKNAILLTLLLFCFLITNAQYKNYRKNYSEKKYVFQEGDRYQPITAAAFAIVPGVGHLYVNQPLRGLIFPAGMIFSSYLIVSGSLNEWSSGWGSEKNHTGEIQMIAGLAGFFGFYLWNFIDAVQIAKIKNMHYRETSVSFQFMPLINITPKNQFDSDVIGISFCMSF